MLVRYQAAPRSDWFSSRTAPTFSGLGLACADAVPHIPAVAAAGNRGLAGLRLQQGEQPVAQGRQLGDRLRDLPAALVCLAQLADVDGIALEGLDPFLQRALAHKALYALDRIALVIQQAADLPQQLDILGPIVPPAAAPLQGPDLGKLGLPEAQHMLWHFKFIGYFTDGAKRACRFLEFARALRGSQLVRLILLPRVLGRDRSAQDAAP